ncbi:hypothetical protein [Zavarzinella formosa]|uniref:hypothetical protein n=1 Tax=Zavarzinella formosa TaxID=360055 RepID=UPI0002DDD034|nr:hypothetical protein [Zavarzinella formosa]
MDRHEDDVPDVKLWSWSAWPDWLAKRPFANMLLFGGGGLIAFFGLLIRASARAMAWGDGGERSAAGFVFAEGFFIDIGMVSMLFGLILVLMGVWRVVR